MSRLPIFGLGRQGGWELRGLGHLGSPSVFAWSFPERREEGPRPSGSEQRVEVGAQVQPSHGLSVSWEQVYFGLFLPAVSLALAYGKSAMTRPCRSSWVPGAVKLSWYPEADRGAPPLSGAPCTGLALSHSLCCANVGCFMGEMDDSLQGEGRREASLASLSPGVCAPVPAGPASACRRLPPLGH